MKVSEITKDFLKQYLRVDGNDFDTEIESHLISAKSLVSSYTGLPLESEDEEEDCIDKHEDIVAAVLTIVSEMFENHLYTQGGTGVNVKINPIVETIRNQYRVNLI